VQEIIEQELISDILLLLQGLPGKMVKPQKDDEFEYYVTAYGQSRLHPGLQGTAKRLAGIGGQFK
jgi:hypothetical protein